MKKSISTILGISFIASTILAKEVGINVIEQNDVYKIAKIITHNSSNDFTKKIFKSLSYDIDKFGNQYFIIEFENNGYIILNNDSSKKLIYAFDVNNAYKGIELASNKNKQININWLDIIGKEIPLHKIRENRSFSKKTKRSSSNTLITKIIWSSGSTRTDFDLFIKSPDGQICNWYYKDKSEWGAKHLRDDLGKAYSTSYEAFSVDLNKMDEYATENNLFSNDNGNYKFYIARYSGANINYEFSYGYSNECSAYNEYSCPNGKWIQSVDNIGIDNATYGVRYTPQYREQNTETTEYKINDVKLESSEEIKSLYKWTVKTSSNISKVEIVFTDANNLTKEFTKISSGVFEYSKNISSLGENREYLINAYNSDNELVDSKSGKYNVYYPIAESLDYPLDDFSNNGGYEFLDEATYSGGTVYHPGEDWNINGTSCSGDAGEDVNSIGDGQVVYVNSSSWGGLVIAHRYNNQNYYSQYGHIQNIEVSVGDIVSRGDKVAEIGNVGMGSDGCAHLHFEIRNSNHPNPTNGSYWIYGDNGLGNEDNVESWYEDPNEFL